MSDRLTTDDGDRTLFDCPLCSQRGRVDLHGDRVAVRCFAGCREAAVLEALDLDRIKEEMRSRSANGAGPAAAPVEVGAPHHRTDLGNADRLVTAYGSNLRCVPGLGWHVWEWPALPPRYGWRRHALRQAGAPPHAQRGRGSRTSTRARSLLHRV